MTDNYDDHDHDSADGDHDDDGDCDADDDDFKSDNKRGFNACTEDWSCRLKWEAFRNANDETLGDFLDLIFLIYFKFGLILSRSIKVCQ